MIDTLSAENWPLFLIQLTPFSLILDLLIPHFYKTLDPIGSNFILLRANPGYWKFGEVSPPLTVCYLLRRV